MKFSQLLLFRFRSRDLYSESVRSSITADYTRSIRKVCQFGLFVSFILLIGFSVLRPTFSLSAAEQSVKKSTTLPSAEQSKNSSVQIDCNFPGGNIIFQKIEGDTVRLDRDIRDTEGDWFYWAFRIRGAENRTLKFIFKHACIGTRGPAVSSDGGRTWRWAGEPGFSWTEFTWKFGPNDTDLRFAFAPTYTSANLELFLAGHPEIKLQKHLLCRSKKGRDVFYYTFGNANNPNRLGAVLTCRQHSCEMMASFALEGILETVFSNRPEGKWLRENVEFLMVPFVDLDGVELGDQGKNRRPHDHNFDFKLKIHPEIAAITKLVPEWRKNKKLFMHDFHCPWNRNRINETLYYPGPENKYMAAQLKRFALLLERRQKSAVIPYRESNNLPFGKEWNIGTGSKDFHNFRQWSGSLPNVFFGNLMEIPYANASGAIVSPDSVRELGRNIGLTIAEFLQQELASPGNKTNGEELSPSDALPAVRYNPQGNYLKIGGVYPHLTAYNQVPTEKGLSTKHGEAGIGALVPWAGRLWYLTYPQHQTTGSNDKLYSIDEKHHLTVHKESLGGTHANRLIHRESKQLFMGYYAIDDKGKIRTFDPNILIGRMTSTMRHLTDPANKIYFYDMEGAIYEADVHTLKVTRLFEKAFPGWHGKGAYTGQNRVVFANNGGTVGQKTPTTLLVGGAQTGPEDAGILAQWDGKQRFEILLQRQFTDVTGPGGIYGATNESDPIWTEGWDKRSVLLKLLDGGIWRTYRVPKASFTFDPKHGWYTEWPRIRETDPGRFLMVMHASMFDFPKTFSAGNTAGLRPIASHLRYIPDFCCWKGQLVLASDETSMQGNPMCGQAQSNLWFGSMEELKQFGPKIGWGGVWMNDPVQKDVPSDPYLLAGYEQRVLHLKSAPGSTFVLQIDRNGTGKWTDLQKVTVEKSGYSATIFPTDLQAEWIRLVPRQNGTASACFHYMTNRKYTSDDSKIFDSLYEIKEADAEKEKFTGGIIRPATNNRALQWLAKRSYFGDGEYYEVELNADASGLQFTARPTEESDEIKKVGGRDGLGFTVDAASVVLKDKAGKIFRIPKGANVFDTRIVRGLREVESERYLAQFHGTFYEVPRFGIHVYPDFERMKPVATHSKLIDDFCTWRGLLVLCGTKKGAKINDGHFFAGSNGNGLWFGQIDELWKLGKPTGTGGPLNKTAVEPGKKSDPYLMTGYDDKTIELSHDAGENVRFDLEIDFDHSGFVLYRSFDIPAGEKVTYRFPKGFNAHWLRVSTDKKCRATANCLYR